MTVGALLTFCLLVTALFVVLKESSTSTSNETVVRKGSSTSTSNETVVRKGSSTSTSNEIVANASAKCIPGKRDNDSADYITTLEFIRKNGYKAEEHTVVTKDGYILTLHRIPPKNLNAVPVFIQHGVLSSSFDWVVAGKDEALAFLLADKGYDVWLGNARGNTYSRCHTRYTTADYKFWDFSFHEMGLYDLPAVIAHIADIARQKLIYVGHSMGTTMFFIMASERQDIAAKVRAMYSLSTVAYMGRAKTALRIFKPFERELELYPEIFGTYECLPQHPMVKNFLKFLCTPTEVQRDFCSTALFTVFGASPYQSNSSLLPMILTNVPAGISFKIALHYLQEINSEKFQYYDYGKEENLRRYSSEEPPSYDISKIQVPIGIFWAPNDYLSDPLDVQQFCQQLPNVMFKHQVTTPLWNHVDYLWAKDVRNDVNKKLLSKIHHLS